MGCVMKLIVQNGRKAFKNCNKVKQNVEKNLK